MVKRIPAWVWVLLLGALLYLPRLGSFGLLDPYEIRYASQAQEIARGTAHLAPGKPPLAALVAAAGVKLLGPSELGGRLPEALCGILGLLAVYWAGASLFCRRTGLIAAALLGLCPSYLLQSRSMASEVASAAAVALALAGLGRFALHQRTRDLCAGVAGVAWATYGAGGLLGLFVPLGAWLFAMTFGGDLLGGAAKARQRMFLGAAIAAVAAGVALIAIPGTTQAALLGGVWRLGPTTNTFEEAIKHIGFGLFPASALFPLALGHVVALPAPAPDAPEEARKRAWARLYVLSFAALAISAYALSVLHIGSELRFSGWAPLALLCGVFLDEILGDETSHPLLAACAAVCMLLIARDFFLYPEDFAAAHIREGLRWPPELAIGTPVLLLSAAAAGALALGLLIPAAARRRTLLAASLGAVVLLALWNAQLVTPTLSRHWSFKSMFDRYRSLARAGEPLRSYRVAGQGVEYYAHGPIKDLGSPQGLIDYLRGAAGGCVYALVPNEELGSLDQQLRAAQAAYYVVDTSSSRFLLLSSCLQPGQRDGNPLRVYVRTQPPNPGRVVHADWEGKVELLGVDVPDQVSRVSDGRFTITLHYHVKDKVPAGYKVFLHFDGCGTRFNGDHVPLSGKFPTQFWSPGDYISDPFVVDVPLMTTVGCVYHIFGGFFLGDTRLKLAPGSPEEAPGTNRVPLGTISVH